MATIQENKAYIEDSSRFPKLQSVELVQPRYQFTNEEYNRIVEYLGQLYARSQSAVTTVDASLDNSSLNPVENRAVAAAIAQLTARTNRIVVSCFADIKASGTAKQASSSLSSEPEEVYFFLDAGTFGFKPTTGSIIVSGEYYLNWQNRNEYTADNLEPYTAKVYYCIADKTLYVFDDGELVPISGSDIDVDSALSTSSENPVQNKVVTNALNGKVGGADYNNGSLVLYSDFQKTNEIDRVNLNVNRILNFEIDNTTGCLMMTEENMGDSVDFEIDEFGNLNLIIE